MSSRVGKSAGLLILIIIICSLAGGAVGEILGNSIKQLAFLKTSYNIGMTKPLILNLKLISITFGVSFSFNLLSIAGLLIGLFIYRKM
jgi:hypothetical protein